MTNNLSNLELRIESLELNTRRSRVVAFTAMLALAATWLTGARGQPESSVQPVVRTQLLVIEDAAGRERIVLGAPVPDERQVVGMKILDPSGAEQFGLTLKPDGSMGMGFDVKPGVGNPDNRERLNLGVTSTGQGWIRYLDNSTRARLFIRLDSTGGPSLQFLDWTNEELIQMRQLDYQGERYTSRPR